MAPVRWYEYSRARLWRCAPPDPAAEAFHRSWPGYSPSPLVDAPGLAEEMGVGRVLVKDESDRMGLPSFKILGASWAVFRALSARIGGQPPATFAELAERMNPLSPVELIAATEGNHGRAVAHLARLLGLKCRVYVPSGTDENVVAAIRGEGAEVATVAGPYDEAVLRAADVVQRAGPDALLIQDTAWSGYTEIPAWVVEGYVTILSEIDAQVEMEEGSLVAVPVGVGSLLQATLAHYRSSIDARRRPAVLGVEPETAACVLESLVAGELKTIRTTHTVMTGLNCGTPSGLAWRCVREGLDGAIAISDEEAVAAVDDLAGIGIATRPTGAAALAGARAALTGDGGPSRRRALGVDDTSTVVLLCTEGPVETDVADQAG